MVLDGGHYRSLVALEAPAALTLNSLVHRTSLLDHTDPVLPFCCVGMARVRWYVTGSVCVEAHGEAVGEHSLPGGKAVVALSMLAVEHHRSVSRGEIAEVVWGDVLPRQWETDLRSILSRLRTSLRQLEGAAESIVATNGGYQLRLDPDGWVDFDEAVSSTHLAEAALASGNCDDAASAAWVAEAISRRGFLDHREAVWIDEQRHRLRSLRLRALDALSGALSGIGDHHDAIRHAELAVATDPLRERSHRHLIRACAAAGDRAAAARAYKECESVLRTELGIRPGPETLREYELAVGG